MWIVRLYLLAGIILFNLSGVAQAEGTYITRGDVELYGKASFLMRISPNHSFSVKLDDHTDQDCKIDAPLLTKVLSRQVTTRGKKLVPTTDHPQFSYHLEVFGEIHKRTHCMIGYELGLQGNNARNDHAGSLLSQFYDYENSYQLIEIKGIIHTDKDKLNDILSDEVTSSSSTIFDILDGIQDKILPLMK